MAKVSKLFANIFMFFFWAPIMSIAACVWANNDSMDEDLGYATALISAIGLLVWLPVILLMVQGWGIIAIMVGYFLLLGFLEFVFRSRGGPALPWQ